MPILVDDLITELREHIGVGDELTSAQAILLLNRSLWELSDKFPFREKELTTTFVTVVGTILYTVPAVPFEAIQVISIKDNLSNVHTPLDRMTLHEYEKVFDEDIDMYDKPTSYFRRDDKIGLWPTPNDVFTITLRYLSGIIDLVSGATPDIPRVWHEIILLGAVWRGFLRLGDHNRAEAFKAHQIALINSTEPVESKEEIDTHTGGVEVLGRDYDW